MELPIKKVYTFKSLVGLFSMFASLFSNGYLVDCSHLLDDCEKTFLAPLRTFVGFRELSFMPTLSFAERSETSVVVSEQTNCVLFPFYDNPFSVLPTFLG